MSQRDDLMSRSGLTGRSSSRAYHGGMIGLVHPHRFVVLALAAGLVSLGACTPRPPEVTREVLGLDVTGRPVVSFKTCERYGLFGTLGGCSRETPPVVWCYETLADNDCYGKPDRFATREPEPIVDVPILPTIYALPTPPAQPATLPPHTRPESAAHK